MFEWYTPWNENINEDTYWEKYTPLVEAKIKQDILDLLIWEAQCEIALHNPTFH
jgi:hypothetical protein